ncbi:MAG: four helix bundle protein [Taibaiella sp.]|nr:four helix bundle protein [Taibaiella sp.]
MSESEPSLSLFSLAPAPFPAQKKYLHIMFPYENLDVYKKAYSVNQIVYRLLKGNKSIPGYARDQLGRASLSIMLNIAEGSAKFSIMTGEIFMLLPGARHSSAQRWSLFSKMKMKLRTRHLKH